MKGVFTYVSVKRWNMSPVYTKQVDKVCGPLSTYTDGALLGVGSDVKLS